ncbi:MAG: aminotransferase class V-fold PLP-dependent enzyme [Candidatus Thorarchaeota archaeon]
MTSKIDPEFIAQHFPSLKEMAYLNNAATGIPPIEAINAMKGYLDNRVEALGSFEETLETFSNIRSKLTKLLGGNPSEYGFAPSTSAGLNVLAHGIDYPENSNIIICDLEFPSNYIPWQNAAKIYGAELRVMESKNGAIQLSNLIDKIDENTRVVAISMTQFSSGYRANIPEMAKIVHEQDAYLVADIIQAAGWQNIDLSEMGVDFAAAQAAKWLLGPIGAGFIFVNKKILNDVKPRYMGWWGVENMHEFAYSDRIPTRDATKFEVGSPAMIAYVGFNKSLDLLLSIPAADRESVALENAEYLKQKLDDLNVGYYEFEEENKSPIVSCTPDNVEDLQKELHKNNIHCSVRNGRLRVSPHFYNSKEEIDQLVAKMR